MHHGHDSRAGERRKEKWAVASSVSGGLVVVRAAMLRPSSASGTASRYDGGEAGPAPATKFATFKFSYNGRVAFALVPAAVSVVSAGGTPALGCTAVGLIIAYILDVSLIGEGALVAVWLTLLADYLCLAFGGNIFNDRTSLGLSLMLSFACGQTLFLLGTWASLQVRSQHN